MKQIALLLYLSCIILILSTNPCFCDTDKENAERFDVVIVGGTPGGIMAAIAVARGGHTAVILERTHHIGGLPANGLGATDISTRGATGGLFTEFVGRIRDYYVNTYGADSQQVKDCSDGYHFEPHVAEMIFEQMLAEHDKKITVRKWRQFDALPKNVSFEKGAIAGIIVTNRENGKQESYRADVFMDATYEGDLAAAAGADYLLGRESKSDFDEPMAGRLYKKWRGPVGPGSTGLGDNAVQAYNFRLCLTKRKDNMVPIWQPDGYDREEYVSLIQDIKEDRTTAKHWREMAFDGIGRLTNMVSLPNGKTDANNQHLAFISTDLPEENWPWPTSGWDWRDRFAERLRDYTLGLIWFAQHDRELPREFRERCLEWGFAKDEYVDNDNFPRQVYVREGRRVVGEYLFTAHDAIPVEQDSRPPIHSDSITASHYALDSHAVRKREPGRYHLDGFFSYPTKPYTVPYGVIVPTKVEGLLTPVPVSGTHIGFSTLRMEPCWMAMGQAAGTAACIAIDRKISPKKIDITELQDRLLEQSAVLIYFEDTEPTDKHYRALQYFALRGFYPISAWEAKLNEIVPENIALKWIDWAQVQRPSDYKPGETTRGELLDMLYRKVSELPPEERSTVRAHP